LTLTVLERFRRGVGRVAEVAGRGVFVAGALNRVGALSAISPTGLAGFVLRAGVRFKLHHAFLLHATNKPEKVALIAGARRLRYAELDHEANRLANALAELGAGAGARVAILLPNSIEFIVTGEALPRIGASAVQIGTRLKPAEVAHILENARPAAIIVHREYRAVLEEAIARSGVAAGAVLVVGSDREIGDAVCYRAALERASDADPRASGDTGGGVIVYTSGTTGKPKGASRDYAQTGMAAVLDLLSKVGADHDEIHLVVCPLYHSAAPAFVKMVYSLGGTVVLSARFEPEEVLATIERERVTSAFMVPTQLRRLADLEPAVRRRYDTSSLRWVMSGAAPLPTETARRFMESYGPLLWNFYGATETGLVSLAGPADHLARPGTVGRLLRENEVAILDDRGARLPVGEIGELWVRNGTLITGYHRNDAATRDATREGFLFVGDLARLDRDGYLYIESRKDDMVISGGVNIYPREIEDALHQHPSITEAAVVGVPDPEWGESLVAFVARAPGRTLTAEQVIEHCRGELADYKRPRRVVFVDELPRNPTGKVLKRVLRDRA
jgi:fatty-acyl-CoA synthase